MKLTRWLIAILFAPLILIAGAIALPIMLISLPVFYLLHISKRANFRHPLHLVRTKMGWGKNIAELARRLNIPESELRAFVPRYTEARIPKRSGGTRKLLVPDEKTKALQRALLRRVFAKLRSHPAAFGFEQGRSIVENALPHVGRCVVIRMDIVDFFPSTTAARLDKYFRRIGWNAEAAALLVKLTTHENGLPQGAPTSPRLSNLVNFILDVWLAKFAGRRKGVYTRYADDITFSFPKDYPKRVRGVVQVTARHLKRLGYRMHARKKLHIRRRHQRQSVTGLVVNEKLQLNRETRRWLRAVRHRIASGQPATLTPEQLAGWTAYEAMIKTRARS